jgi:cytochrome bd-type quinol oxidase subunit 1
MNIPWILVSIIITILILAILAIFTFKRKGWNREVDYRSYFNMGIVWLPLGIIFYAIFKNLVGAWFFIIGLVYIAIGLKNKDKWGKPQKISPVYQKALMMAVILGVFFLVLGIIVFEITR